MKKQTQSTQSNKTLAFALATLLIAAGAAAAADGSDPRAAQDSNRQAAQATAKGEGVDVDQKPGGGGRRAPTAVCFTTGSRIGCPAPLPPRPRNACTAVNDIFGLFVDVDFKCP